MYQIKFSSRDFNKKAIAEVVAELNLNVDHVGALAFAGVLEQSAKVLREKHTQPLLDNEEFTDDTFHGIKVQKVAGSSKTTVQENKEMLKLSAQIAKQKEATDKLQAQYDWLKKLQVDAGNFTKEAGKPTIRVTVP